MWNTSWYEGDGELKLKELAVSYRESAQWLAERIRQLKRELEQVEDPLVQNNLRGRIEILWAMYRETRDVAVVCERYYERGYCRNAKYKI